MDIYCFAKFPEMSVYTLCLLLLLVASAIVGGQETNPNEYPWNIILYRNGSFYCTGTIISPWSVLTAADCVQPDPQQR